MDAYAERKCQPAIAETCRHLLDLHIQPALGGPTLAEFDGLHVAALHPSLRDRPSQANRAVGVFSKMLKLAVAWGMTLAWPDPRRSIRRYSQTGEGCG